MAFAGVANAKDRGDLLEYLKNAKAWVNFVYNIQIGKYFERTFIVFVYN